MNEEDVRRIVRQLIEELVQPKIDDLEQGVVAVGAMAEALKGSQNHRNKAVQAHNTLLKDLRLRLAAMEAEEDGDVASHDYLWQGVQTVARENLQHDARITRLEARQAGVSPLNLGMGLPKGLLD